MEQFGLHRFPHDSRKEQHVLKRCAWQPGSQQLTNKLLATLTFNASGAHDVKLAAENTRLTANQLKAPFRLVKVCRAACAGDRHVISCFKYKKLQGQHKWTIFCMFVHCWSACCLSSTLWNSFRSPCYATTRPNCNSGRGRNLGKP